MSILKFNLTIINIALGICVVILSFYTIVWHHQNYLLYKQSRAVQMENRKIISVQKYLNAQQAEQMNGFWIKNKAINTLKMIPIPISQKRHISL